MDAYAQTALGIVVSIALFLIGYRQTIGAREERIRVANKAVHKALLRRLVLEDYEPEAKDISRVIEGKAHDFQLTSVDLVPEPQVLIQLYAEVFDNDFIAPAKRREIEKRLEGAIDAFLKDSEHQEDRPSYDVDSRGPRYRMIASLALAASALGTTVTLLYRGTEGKSFAPGECMPSIELLTMVLVVFVASLASVVAITLLKKARETPDEQMTKRSAILEGTAFEREVASILAKLGVPFWIEPESAGMRPDFMVELNGRRIAIEVRSWRTPPPMSFLARVIRYAEALLASHGVSEVMIVTRERLPYADKISKPERVSFVTLKELQRRLSERRG
jgi:hypothetical protein